MFRCAETGPWEPRVQLQVIRSGLRYWDELKTPQRDLVRGKVQDALKVQPREVFELARFYARPDLICDAGSTYKQIGSWCESVF